MKQTQRVLLATLEGATSPSRPVLSLGCATFGAGTMVAFSATMSKPWLLLLPITLAVAVRPGPARADGPPVKDLDSIRIGLIRSSLPDDVAASAMGGLAERFGDLPSTGFGKRERKVPRTGVKTVRFSSRTEDPKRFASVNVSRKGAAVQMTVSSTADGQVGQFFDREVDVTRVRVNDEANPTALTATRLRTTRGGNPSFDQELEKLEARRLLPSIMGLPTIYVVKQGLYRRLGAKESFKQIANKTRIRLGRATRAPR